METKDVVTIVIGIFFALSALSLGISQIIGSQATDTLVLHLIQYQNHNKLDNAESVAYTLINSQLLIDNRQALNTNHACLQYILVLNNVQQLDSEIYKEYTNLCLNVSNNYDDIMAQYYNISNIRDSVNLTINSTASLNLFEELSKDSSYFTYASIILFGIGILIFYIYWAYSLIKKK